VAYVNLKASFDSVDRNVLWLLLASSGLPPEIINLFKAHYTGTLSCVRVNGYDSQRNFSVLNGVRQGCVVASDLSESHGLVARAHCTSKHGGHVRWFRESLAPTAIAHINNTLSYTGLSTAAHLLLATLRHWPGSRRSYAIFLVVRVPLGCELWIINFLNFSFP